MTVGLVAGPFRAARGSEAVTLLFGFSDRAFHIGNVFGIVFAQPSFFSGDVHVLLSTLFYEVRPVRRVAVVVVSVPTSLRSGPPVQQAHLSKSESSLMFPAKSVNPRVQGVPLLR